MAFGIDDALLVALQAAPSMMQFFGQNEPNVPQYGAIPQPGGGRPSVGGAMSTRGGGGMDPGMMAMQMLLGIMARLMQGQGQGGGQNPMQQFANQAPGAGSPLQGNSMQQPVPRLPGVPSAMRTS